MSSQARPANNIGYLLQHTASLLAKQTDQVLQEQLGIGFSQFKILRALQTSPQMKQREIAFNLGQTEASISRQVKLMIDDGLLRSTISPKNRRVHLTVPTAKGVKLTEAALIVLQKYFAPAFSALSEKQQQCLRESLETLHQQVCTSPHPNPVNAVHPEKF